jgi:bifunctional ADP-heptose synthase (sugar kinase/adenylyltransferase)
VNVQPALDLIASVASSRVLFVGDTIIDEYQYISPLGKASKENIIATKFERRESFEGGVTAAAKHAQSFCAAVNVWSYGTAVRKVRFVEEAYLRKIFEVHYAEVTDTEFTGLQLGGYDCVAVTDFGHGAISPALVSRMCNEDIYLAVCAQTNSANQGYNLITKYCNADYIVIDEPEARLAAADKTSDIEDVILHLANDCLAENGKFIVTHGKSGATGYDAYTREFYHCGAFADTVVDTMGAGDAFFAVTAPMAKHGGVEDLLVIGNAAGAIKTQIVGHRASVTKHALIELLGSL